MTAQEVAARHRSSRSSLGVALPSRCTSRSCCAARSYPLLVASQAVPIVVVAPLLVVWFGFGLAPKLAIIALVCFFPVVVTTLDGCARVDPERASCCARSTPRAGRRSAARGAGGAAAALFTGAKVAVAVAVIGAVFAE